MCCLEPDLTWYPDVNEAGWQCLNCGQKLGFRPDLDRTQTFNKVMAILQDFQMSKLIYVSNGTMGEIIAGNVAVRCERENRYDQWGILEYILQDPNLAGHGAFWRNRAERYLLGGEPISQEQEALAFD